MRVPQSGGRLGIGDVTADDGLDPGRLAEAGQQAGSIDGTLTQAQYRELLPRPGSPGTAITSAYQAGPGLDCAIIQAAEPVTGHR